MNRVTTETPRFLRACRSQPVDRTPIWIMRQAGRYLPEYREIRKSHTLLEICRAPELACEVALQPLRRFDLDAAILFSDLLVPVAALGVDFDIVEKSGPVVGRPVRDREAVGSLKLSPDLRELECVFETVRLLRKAISVPLIGFAGAPFTVGSYLIEGGPSRDFRQTRLLMLREPEVFYDLMERLADLMIAYVSGQAAAGIQAVQIFDSWVGVLSPADYRRHVLRPTRRIFQAIAKLGIPSIHFGTGTAALLDHMAEAGGDVLGVDWRIPLGQVRARFPERAVQGNLDPQALFAPGEVLDRMIDEVLAEAAGAPGHIFNLGHGILPESPIENVTFMVEAVHSRTVRMD